MHIHVLQLTFVTPLCSRTLSNMLTVSLWIFSIASCSWLNRAERERERERERGGGDEWKGKGEVEG